MKKFFTFFLLLFMSFSWAADYYWVGGSGKWSEIEHWRTTSGGTSLPSVIPGPTDNVFFDAKSGFTTSSKTVMLDNTVNCHNITFSGSAVAPTLTQSGSQTLNIYGSSEWQTGMGTIIVSNIYYRHTGEAKTIKSNGVKTGNNNLYFEEENSISLNDSFIVGGYLFHQAGTWNTNNFDVTIGFFYDASSGPKVRVINLGNSNIYLTSREASFITSSSLVTLNAGTSHIHFTNFVKDYNTSYQGFSVNGGQTFYDVTFEGTGGQINPHSGIVNFNKVEFKGDGAINGNNTVKTLVFSPTKTYVLASEATQTITNLFSANTPQCGGWSTITSSTAGTQANIIATAGTNVVVSGVIMKDIKISGDKIFTANNSVNNGNNSGWVFPSYMGQNLYWVGGSGNWNDKIHWSQTSGNTGGYCVPGPTDNTFFDNGSGFATNNKTVTVDNTSYTRNITFSGSVVAPTLTQSGSQTFNIYGSSEWQTGMGTINVSKIYYRHTGEAKTIKSNGVFTSNSSNLVYFEEESSISLNDAFTAGFLYHQAGTWNTNNYDVTIGYNFDTTNGPKVRVINLGSSQVYLKLSYASFITTSSFVTLNAGTSHIHFTDFKNDYNTEGYGLIGLDGQTFYDVTFESTGGQINGNNGIVNFNKVEFKGDGVINGNNIFKNLIFSAGKTYNLQNAKTQTIENLTLGGTPCDVTSVKSNTSGTKANINLTGDVTNFNFGNLKDINASGKTLHFGEQSTIANQNNSSNITYDPYNPGSFEGLGADWIDHVVDPNKPSTYILGTQNFYGNNRTTYKWYKTGGLGSNATTIISTAKEIDIRKFGYGTYKVVVEYSNGTMVTCSSDDEVYLKGLLRKVIVNPSIRIRVK